MTDAANRPGCLLIHGYGGGPFEMEGMAAALAEAGIFTRVVCLPGHGDDVENFRRYRFPDWLAHAENELATLMRSRSRVMLVGFSMGGTLALNLAARYPVACVAALSTPLYVLSVMPWPLTHAGFYGATGLEQLRRMLRPFRKEAEGAGGETSREIAPWKGYSGPVNLGQLVSFRKGCAATRALLPKVTAPLLVMQDAGDRVVYAGNAWEILRRVSSVDAELVLTRIQETTTRHHMIVTHRETAALVEKRLVRHCLEKGLDPVR
ncbi:alpha/beta fold hydrolase [Desulfovibrio sp. OttesenSCG-928-O18]|nr:alpha/beta fold hydrolase [Desulfovibrio sp. OttesenSCG-928-O18]